MDGLDGLNVWKAREIKKTRENFQKFWMCFCLDHLCSLCIRYSICIIRATRPRWVALPVPILAESVKVGQSGHSQDVRSAAVTLECSSPKIYQPRSWKYLRPLPSQGQVVSKYLSPLHHPSVNSNNQRPELIHFSHHTCRAKEARCESLLHRFLDNLASCHRNPIRTTGLGTNDYSVIPATY